MERLTKFQGFI